MHSGIAIAVVAHAVIALTLLWDKVLLGKKQTQNIVGYVFWFGVLSAFGPCLAFFGNIHPNFRSAGFALAGGGLYVISNYFYFVTLSTSESSQAVPIMGGLSPVATALIGLPILHNNISGTALWGFCFLVAGSLLLSFSTSFDIRMILPFAILSAAFFGLTNVVQKIAFQDGGFLEGYVFFTTGIFLFSLAFLLRKAWRRDIMSQLRTMDGKTRRSYFTNRFIERIGSLLVFLAISRANPAIVEALGGLRYSIVFAGAYLITRFRPQWLDESFSLRAAVFKSLSTAAVIGGLVLVAVGSKR